MHNNLVLDLKTQQKALKVGYNLAEKLSIWYSTKQTNFRYQVIVAVAKVAAYFWVSRANLGGAKLFFGFRL